ncbi:protein phosphatase 2C domain-containing protein [Salisaeta longa]|uniref:protein phosphatase 2C domain-containing protein n=1 Tax=Salisaeta longa TaxID=503170 RepID=UPI00048BCBB2|nr:protein phosphatase 2C domain-containing protein [Salisaeta longa]
MIPLTAHGTTFPGRRDVNQDDVLHCYPGPGAFFFAVADGMGGVAGGKIASETVLDTCNEYLAVRMQKQVAPSDLKEIMGEMYSRCQAAIRAVTDERPDLEGMGTTLTCMLGYEGQYIIGNLGDSRVYRLHEGQMEQVTEDHSYLNEFKKKSGGQPLDPDFVAQYGHIINKTLDGSDDTPDFFPQDRTAYTLASGDGFLLCSDGLIVDQLQDQAQLFKSYMMGTPDLQTAAESLVSLAYYSGSMDNISVVLVEAGELQRDLGRVRTYPFPPRQEEEHA